MSLLDRNLPESVVVFPEEMWLDDDGNKHTGPAQVGIPERACIQVASMSGTSARRAEQDNEGFESEKQYRIRFRRDMPILGAQSQVEWRGQRWSIFGDHNHYNGSRRTRHVDYLIKRA